MSTLCQQMASIWPVDQQDVAQSVCMAESGGDATAHCLNCSGVIEDSRGLWQINVDAHPDLAGQNLYDPATNAQAAYQIWQSSGWGAWSTYTDGAYKAFLTGASNSPSSIVTPHPALLPIGLGLGALALLIIINGG